MKYKIKSGKSLSDFKAVGDISRNISGNMRNRYPLLLGIFIYLFDYLIGIGSFVSRSLLRGKLGERTYGIVTIAVSYIFILTVQNIFLLVEDIKYSEDYQKAIAEGDISGILLGLKIFMEDFDLFFAILLGEDFFEDLRMEVYVLFIVVSILGAFHFLERAKLKENGRVIHSYYRGDSIFFSWLKNVGFLRSNIRNIHILMIIEPLFIFSTALIFQYLELDVIAAVLKTSAVCLFIEEYRVYGENRQLNLDIVDNYLDSSYALILQKDLEERINHGTQKETKRHSHHASIQNDNRSQLNNEYQNKWESRFKAEIS